MKKIFIYLIILVSFFGCVATKKVPHGEYLLRSNSIYLNYPDSVDRLNRNVSESNLENYIPLSQTPNKRIFGIPLYLNIYNLIDSSKQNWFQTIFKKIGEEAIVYDSLATSNSVRDMVLLMKSNGYYSTIITDSVRYKKDEAFVDYTVKTGSPTIVSDVTYNFIDKSLKDIVISDSLNALVKIGNVLSRTMLDKERYRIVKKLEDIGYYKYSVNNINFTIDTLNKIREASVVVNVGFEKAQSVDSVSDIYRIRNIYINSAYKPQNNEVMMYDTVMYNGIYMISEKDKKPNVKVKILSNALTILPDFIYSKKEVDHTNRNLFNLRFFKSINSDFKEVLDTNSESTNFVGNNTLIPRVTNERYIDWKINCEPMLRQSYKVNGELSTNKNYTGLSVSLGYSNKNLFRGVGVFDVNLNGAYEIMHNGERENSHEFGASVAYTLPRLIVPFRTSRRDNFSSVQTRIEVNHNNQNRPFYHRVLSGAAFGYQWEKNYSKYIFKPFNVSYINVPWIDTSFIADIQNKYLINSYTSQFILGMQGGYNFSTASSGRSLTHNLKLNGEVSGNFLDLITELSDSPYKEDIAGSKYRDALGVRYSQYFKFDVNYVLNQRIKNKSALVFRIYAGGGHAYGNSTSLPFERMLFVGGASSMRGWQVRTLGPGGTPPKANSVYADQVGNLRLEVNLEGRFPIIGPLNGAVFFDCGNIWLNGRGTDVDEISTFKIKTFTDQLALNTGIGARLDFNFFILRLDWGIILRNPGWEQGHQWIRSFNIDNSAIHFGIGYPF